MRARLLTRVVRAYLSSCMKQSGSGNSEKSSSESEIVLSKIRFSFTILVFTTLLFLNAVTCIMVDWTWLDSKTGQSIQSGTALAALLLGIGLILRLGSHYTTELLECLERMGILLL